MGILRVLVTSKKDIASQTIHSVLVNEHGFEKTGREFEGTEIYEFEDKALLITTERDLIEANHLECTFDTDVFIFCSRHRSASGTPALLTHSTGNLGPSADFGGSPRQLSVSCASLISAALEKLNEEKEMRDLDEFDVSLEVTHHGPTSMDTPLLFVELGSDEEYWHHTDGARAVACAAVECIEVPISNEAVIGLGGTHYASKFNKLVLNGVKLGHIAPKYALDEMNKEVLKQMMSRSAENITSAVIDWKGTNAQQREQIIPLLESIDLPLIRARNI